MTLPLLNSSLLLRAYASGLFPMAEHYDSDRVLWIDPDRRGILPLDNIHLPRSLKKIIKKKPFTIKIDYAFEQVLQECAKRTDERNDTWISPPIQKMHRALFEKGHAHCVECWQDDVLVGGLYGIAIGGFFSGESMFSRVSESSKVALYHLVALLRQGGFQLLDVQFMNDHLKRFGAIEIPRGIYLDMLKDAIKVQAYFPSALSSLSKHSTKVTS